MSSFETLALFALAVAAHVALLVASRKINLLFLLAGMFVMLSLLSVAVGLSMFVAAKYARVYTTLLMVMCGVTYYRIHGLQRSAKVFAFFSIYCLLCPLWSVLPLTGLAYKSFFILTLYSGVFLAYSLRDWSEAHQGFRYLVLLTAFGTGYAIVFFTPLDSLRSSLASNRLMFLEINPGRIGATASTMLLLCGYVALYDRSRFWQALSWGTCAMLVMLIVLSGNRSGALVSAVGMCLTAIPLLGRPRRLITVALIAALLGTVGFLCLRDTYGMERMFSLANTRESQWITNKIIFSKSPIFGHGWIFAGTDTGYVNLHSMYFQILAEMGIVGLSLFVGCMMPILIQWLHVYRALRRIPVGAEFVVLPLVFISAALVMGIFETAAMAGTMPDALFWGFGIGLIDRLPALLKRQSQVAAQGMRHPYRFAPGMP